MVSCGKLTSSAALRLPLERLYRDFDYESRLARDAIQYPLRYPDAPDREIVALLSACLAYRRGQRFARPLETALDVLGAPPAACVRDCHAARDGPRRPAFVF